MPLNATPGAMGSKRPKQNSDSERRPFDIPDVTPLPAPARKVPRRIPRLALSSPAPDPEPPEEGWRSNRQHMPLHLPILRQIFLSGEQEREDAIISTIQPSAARLRTGAEAVAFFALHGSSSSIKFVYCNRVSEQGDAFRPYDLVVVPKKKTDPEYFTVSATGIVHICPGQPTTFMPLVDWIRESTNFNVLRSIRFFKHYLPAKTFRLWCSNVRYSIYYKRRKALAANLFLGKPSFHLQLIEINKLMYEMQAIRLLNVKSQTYLAKEFVKDQTEQRLRAGKKFDEILDRLQSTVDAVCTELKERARVSSEGFVNGDSKTIMATMFPHQQKTLSLVKIKEERAQRFRQMRFANREADMLCDFIRLVDYMAVENLVALTLSTNSEFLEVLQTPRKAGLFQTTIAYGPEGLLYGISDSDISSIIQKMVDGMIATVEAVPRISLLNNFKNIVKSGLASPNEPNVAQIIRGSSQFVSTCAAIAERVRHDFLQTVSIAQVFEQWREVHEFGGTWNIKQFRARNPSVEEIQKLMARQAAWHSDVDRNMRPGFAVGIFHIESRKLKNRLLPILDQSIIEMEELLLESFHTRCEEALRQYTQCIGALDRNPDTLSDFANHISSQKKFRSEMPSLTHLSDQVELMHDLLTSSTHKLVLPSQDAVLLDELRSAKKLLAEKMTIEWEKSRTRLPDMREQVDQNISRLNLDLHALDQALSQGMFVDVHAMPEIVLTELTNIGNALQTIQESASTLNKYQTTFDIDPYPFTQLQEVRDKFTLRKDFWTLYQDWIVKTAEWESSSFLSIDIEQMNSLVSAYSKEINRLVRRESSSLTTMIRDLVDDWKSTMPMLLNLANRSLRSKHWETMFAFIGQPYEPIENLDLHQIRTINLLPHTELIADTVAQAVGEFSLQSALSNVKSLWDNLDFPLITYRDSSDVFVLGDIESVLNHLEDSQMTLQTMLSSRFISSFYTDVDEWIKRLSLLNDVIEVWKLVQKTWSYLESIFGAPDIGKQLPTETKRFADVDRIWRDFMRRLHRKPNALGVISTPGIFNILSAANRDLESLKKCLTQYLETKRSKFPRLYFLSDNQLLKVISETRQPGDIQPHLTAIFDTIRDIRFVHANDALQAIGVTTLEGDYINLEQPVSISGNLEDWLLLIEKGMKRTIRDHIRRGLDVFPKNSIGWDTGALKQLTQIATTVEKIVATGLIQAALNGGRDSIGSLLSQTNAQIERYAELVRKGQRTMTQRLTLSALIIANVAQRDLLGLSRDLLTMTWPCRLRYQWDSADGHCNVYIDQCSFRYGYEYLGAYHTLVPTEATIRCQRALATATFWRYGGAVMSATTSGKTESIKDLARYLGMSCLVVSSDKSFDLPIFSQILAGLAQAGVWACFDTIACIRSEVLSAVAQQMLTIRQALMVGRPEFLFEGRVISLNSNIGLFLTMDSGDQSVIPENLKLLFRPIAMMSIDMSFVLKLRLFSEGFTNVEQLSPTMFALLTEFGKSLPKDRTNPISANSVKSISFIAGTYHRSDLNISEEHCIIRAIRKFFSGKLLGDDIAVLDSCIAMHFPSASTTNNSTAIVTSTTLTNAIAAAITAQSFSASPVLVNQILRLHESIKFNQAVVLLGAPGSGKTWATGILANALTSYFQQEPKDNHWKSVIRNVIHPIALTTSQLYGSFNNKQWFDGVFSRLIRDPPPPNVQSWITFDGPLNTVWTHPLRNVLDDNQFLCLSNGERLRISSCYKLVFETDDLKDASPSFLSRSAVVFFNDKVITCSMLVDKWSANYRSRVGNRATKLLSLLQDHIPPILEFIRTNCTENTKSTDLNLVSSCLNLLDILLVPERGADPSLHGEDGVNRVTAMYFLFAIVWSLGANLDDRSQTAFSTFIRGKFAKGRSSGIPLPPEQGSVYDYFVSSERAAYLAWSQKLETFEFDPSHSIDLLVVPTTDTVRYRFLLEAFTSVGSHSLFGSKPGVGKSVVIQSFLQNASQRLQTIPLLMSALSNVNNIHEQIERRVDAKRRAILGPPAGKKLAFFVDDVNLPLLNPETGPAAVEFIRQCLDSKGFHDPHKLTFKRLVDEVFICAMSPTIAGVCNRPVLSPRLVRHFQLLWWAEPTDACTRAIFGAIISTFVRASNPELDECAKLLITAQLAIAQRLQRQLRKSINFYPEYLFSFHDYKKICKGMLLAGVSHKFADKASFVNFWAHEFMRVIRDRFSNPIDTDAIDSTVNEVVRAAIPGISPDLSLTYSIAVNGNESIYAPVTEKIKLLTTLTSFLDGFNQTNPNNQLNLVLFEDAVLHLCRLCRLLRIPGSHSALIGPGATGRQSLTRLASHICNMPCIVASRASLSSMKNLHADLQKLITIAGADNQPVVWCVPDSNISNDTLLIDLKYFVSSGDLDHLFSNEEFEQVLIRVKVAADSTGVSLNNRDETIAHFHKCVKSNVHIVATLNPDSPLFNRRCRAFPYLGRFTVDSYQAWSVQQLYTVAQKFIRTKVGRLDIVELEDPICQTCVHVHQTVINACKLYLTSHDVNVYHTATAYLELVKLYLLMLQEQRDKNSQGIEKYMAGLSKLRESNDLVIRLRDSSQLLQTELQTAVERSNGLLTVLEREQAEANQKSEICEKEATEFGELTRRVEVIKNECEQDLQEALPALEAAMASLNTINKDDLAVLKTFSNPPKLVELVMSAVCLLLGEPQTWAASKRLLGDMQILDILKGFDKTSISNKTLKKLQIYIENPDFDPEKTSMVSSAITSLCQWVCSIYKYAIIYEHVEPKRRALEQAKENLSKSQEILNAKKDMLFEVQSRIESLNNQHKQSLSAQTALRVQGDVLSQRLERAEKLMQHFSNEGSRWNTKLSELESRAKTLPGDVLLAAAQIAYLGPFPQVVRDGLLKDWTAFCTNVSLSTSQRHPLLELFGDALTIKEWCSHGLSPDAYSIENALILYRGRRWPLLIDPQEQGKRWIKSLEGGHNLKVCKASDPNFNTVIEESIVAGDPVLLEDVGESLDFRLYPVLLKQFYTEDGRWYLRMNDHSVSYSANFKLYMTTRLPKPHYSPDLFVLFTALDFTVTRPILDEKLLSIVINNERNDTEDKYKAMLLQVSDSNTQMIDLEDKILKMLSSCRGSILDDISLVEELGSSAATFAVIQTALLETEATLTEIRTTRNQYRSIAQRGTSIYFAANNMSLVCPMYKFSLIEFVADFENCLQLTKELQDLNRIDSLTKTMTKFLFSAVTRSLFEEHRLIFAVLLSLEYSHNAAGFESEISIFLKGAPTAKGSHLPAGIPERAKGWMNQETWTELVNLSAISAFSGLGEDLITNSDWAAFMSDQDASFAPIPANWHTRLTPFQKMIVVKTVRKPRVFFEMQNFVRTILGDELIGGTSDNLHEFIRNCNSVILFLLDTGADPSVILTRTARQINFTTKVISISLGAGQQSFIQETISKAKTSCDWVLIQNCHLARELVPILTATIESCKDDENGKSGFRLFLSASSVDDFPVELLHSCVKVALEKPRDIQSNLLAIYENLPSNSLQECSQPIVLQKVAFALAYFHAVLETRSRYRNAWKEKYQWMHSDFEISLSQIRSSLNDNETIQFNHLREILANINYGARVVDQDDRSILLGYLQEYISESVINPDHKFSGEISSPPLVESLSDAQDFIKKLPDVDLFKVLELDEDVRITTESERAAAVLACLHELYHCAASQDGDLEHDELPEPTGHQN